MNNASLAGWTPMKILGCSEGLQVEWCDLRGIRFTEPFFEQTTARACRDGGGSRPRRRTSLAVLENLSSELGSCSPSGFIFHVSRCGSTLLTQMLAALPQNHVISEAPPIDQLLDTLRASEEVTESQKVARLRGLILALGGRKGEEGGSYFIKFDSWHVLELPLVVKAFPEVPWLFVYREPVEVMVSHQRQRGLQMVPGLVDPRLLGFNQADLSAMKLDEFGVRLLEKIYAAGFEHVSRGSGRGRLVNFSELPSVLWETLGNFWRLAWTNAELECLKEVSRRRAKAPAFLHEEDSSVKQREASAEIRQLVDRWLAAPYAKLEELRRTQAVLPALAARADSASSKSLSQSLTTQSMTR